RSRRSSMVAAPRRALGPRVARAWPGRSLLGRASRKADSRPGAAVQRAVGGGHGGAGPCRGGSAMSAAAVQTPPAVSRAQSHPVLAALVVVPVLATVYQTLVLTDVTGDVIRKGIEGDSYQMLWTNLSWGIATLYGVFLGLWCMARIGARQTISIGLVIFALGN